VDEGLHGDLPPLADPGETMAHLEALDLSKTIPPEAMVSMDGVHPLPLRTIMSMDPLVGVPQGLDLHHTAAPSLGEDPLLLEEVMILNPMARREVVILTGSARLDVDGKSMTLTWRPSTMVAGVRLFLLEEVEEGLVALDQTL